MTEDRFPLNEVQKNLTVQRQGRPDWDKYEYEGRDGLDTTLGYEALYVKGHPAWHTLGTWDPNGDITDPDVMLQKAGQDFETILVPAEYTFNGKRYTAPDKFHSLRDDTGDSLGVVGKIYTTISNREAFAFLKGILGTELIPDSAGCLRGGRTVFMSARLPETVVIDPEGIADGIIPFVGFINSHDGQSPFRWVVSPWRPECGNTERFMTRDAAYSWNVRHTTNWADKMDEVRKGLGLTLTYMDAWKDEEELLLSVRATMKDVDALLANIWKRDDEETTRIANKHEARIGQVHSLFNMEADKCGRNLYAAERAITGYMDHFADVRPRGDLKGNLEAGRALAIMEGTTDGKKSQAHKMLLQRVR